MTQSLLRIAGLSLLLSACSNLPTNLMPFGGEKLQERSRTPADATEFRCGGGKRFYVRHLANDAAWLILADREMRLDKTTTGARYSNGIAVLEFNGSEATLADGTANVYSACKAVATAEK